MDIFASCHCGKSALRIDGDVPGELTRCTCSFCAKRGDLLAYYRPDQLHVTPATEDELYRWNTRQVAHHFCPNCGCSTYSDSPDFQRDGSWDGSTRRIGVNARLFDNVDIDDIPVVTIDGKNLW